MNKYVTLVHPTTHTLEIRTAAGFAADHREQASALLLSGFEVRGAGFYCFNEDGSVTVFGWSEGLRKGPHRDDAEDIFRHNRLARHAMRRELLDNPGCAYRSAA